MEEVNEIKCPFCGKPIVAFDNTMEHAIPLYGCTNAECEKSEDLVGTWEMWTHLVIVVDEMKRKTKFIKAIVDKYEDDK